MEVLIAVCAIAGVITARYAEAGSDKQAYVVTAITIMGAFCATRLIADVAGATMIAILSIPVPTEFHLAVVLIAIIAFLAVFLAGVVATFSLFYRTTREC